MCSPSRAVLLTGRHHIRAGVYSWIHDASQNSHLLERETTIAEHLRAAGYATAHVGKWHLGLPTKERQKPTPAWIPIIKSGGYKNYQLFNLKEDPQQENNLAETQPERLAELKGKLLEINKSIMADGHDWHLKEIGNRDPEPD